MNIDLCYNMQKMKMAGSWGYSKEFTTKYEDNPKRIYFWNKYIDEWQYV